MLCNVVSFVIVYNILKVSHQKKDDSSKVLIFYPEKLLLAFK